MSNLQKVYTELGQHYDKVINNISDTIVTTIVEGELLGFKQTCAKEFDIVLERLGKAPSVMNLIDNGKNEAAWTKVKSEYCSAIHKARVAAYQSLDNQVAKARGLIDDICDKSTQEVNGLQEKFK